MQAEGIRIFTINLDRSPDRWQAIAGQLERAKLPFTRVSGVDGGDPAVTFDPAKIDVRGFKFCNGRPPLAGEFGCYMSHVKVLAAFLASDDGYAVVLEDDAELAPAFGETVRAIIAECPDVDVVKLSNHRKSGFVAFRRLSGGVTLGRCLHGPIGSARAYLVSRAGARKLLSVAMPMRLPYDVQLERFFRHGSVYFTIKADVVRRSSQRFPSLIASRSGKDSYGAKKYNFFWRLPTLLFRTADYVQRIAAFGRFRYGSSGRGDVER